jgi:hypothetical protein
VTWTPNIFLLWQFQLLIRDGPLKSATLVHLVWAEQGAVRPGLAICGGVADWLPADLGLGVWTAARGAGYSWGSSCCWVVLVAEAEAQLVLLTLLPYLLLLVLLLLSMRLVCFWLWV